MELHVDQLFTTDSLLTLQGSAAAAWLIPNVLGAIFPIPDRLRAAFALLIALGLSFYAATLGEGEGITTWLIALLNGFLIAGSALGFNQAARPRDAAPVTAPAPSPAPSMAPAGPGASGSADRAARDEGYVPPPQPAPGPASSGSQRGFLRSWL
jgi:hypothetical protein